MDIGVVWNTYAPDGTRARFDVSDLEQEMRRVATHVIGVDPSPDDMPDLIARHPDLDLRIADVERLGEAIDVEPIDLVVMGDVIEHLSNPGNALDAIAPFLAGGGQLLISCPNAYGGPNWARFLLGRYRESPTHVTAHTKLTLANLLDRHGYAVDEVWTCLDRVPRSPKERLLFRIGRPVLSRLPDLGGTLLVLASPSEHRH